MPLRRALLRHSGLVPLLLAVACGAGCRGGGAKWPAFGRTHVPAQSEPEMEFAERTEEPPEPADEINTPLESLADAEPDAEERPSEGGNVLTRWLTPGGRHAKKERLTLSRTDRDDDADDEFDADSGDADKFEF